MKDLYYICANMSALSGIPVRIYENKLLQKTFFSIELKKDPVNLYIKELLSSSKHVEYKICDYQIYGIIKKGNTRILIGPIGQFLNDTKKLEELGFLLGYSDTNELNTFVNDLKYITNMPLESFLLMLCSINLYINNEALSIEDITIDQDYQNQLNNLLESSITNLRYENMGDVVVTHHNAFAFEKMMLSFVENGDVERLTLYLEESSPGTYGNVAPNLIRQSKNLFIVSATLVSRAAIKGGLDQDEAFSLSDYYIQQCEQLNILHSIQNLSFFMVIDYANRVSAIRHGKTNNSMVLEAISYIKKNLVNIHSTTEIADALFVSRNYLGFVFSKETGFTLAKFIQMEKINEAKRLLSHTKRPITAISNYLNYSSQSHFTNTFKSVVGITPNAYRESTRE